MAWSKLIDMEPSDDDKMDTIMPIAMPSKPDYPFGLRICLTHVELEKLGLPLPDKGDVIDLRAFAEVTHVTSSDGEGGETCRVELTIQKLAVENENHEDEEE